MRAIEITAYLFLAADADATYIPPCLLCGATSSPQQLTTAVAHRPRHEFHVCAWCKFASTCSKCKRICLPNAFNCGSCHCMHILPVIMCIAHRPLDGRARQASDDVDNRRMYSVAVMLSFRIRRHFFKWLHSEMPCGVWEKIQISIKSSRRKKALLFCRIASKPIRLNGRNTKICSATIQHRTIHQLAGHSAARSTVSSIVNYGAWPRSVAYSREK